MPFPGNQIFPGKIWGIFRPDHSGISSSRSPLSPENETGIPELDFFVVLFICSVQYQIYRKVSDFSSFQDHSRLFQIGTEQSRPVPNFSQIFLSTGPEKSSLVPPIREMIASPVLSCLASNELGNADLQRRGEH